MTEEGLLPVARIVPLLPTNILHHRLDLMLQTVVNKNTLCIYRNRIVTLCKEINIFIQVAIAFVFTDVKRHNLLFFLFSFFF